MVLPDAHIMAPLMPHLASLRTLRIRGSQALLCPAHVELLAELAGLQVCGQWLPPARERR